MIIFEGLKELLLSLNPINVFLFFILSIFLSLLWLSFCLYLDRQAPEPKKEILRIFLWGGFIVFPVLLITGPITSFISQIEWLNNVVQIFILSFLVDGLFEEWAKYVILSEKVFSSKYFDEPRDGIIYGMVVGLGFSLIENLLYSLTYIDLKIGLILIFLRNFTAVVMHFLAAGIVGYHLGLVKFLYPFQPRWKKLLIGQGLILAILLHGFYNTFVRFGYNWTFIPLTILLVWASIFIISGLRKISRFKINEPPTQKQ